MTPEANHFQKEGKSLGVEELKDLILTNEQYKDQPFAHAEGERIYTFELTNGQKKILYFGSAHTNNPDDPIFEDIKKRFDELDPEIVYVEGWRSINDKKDAVREGAKNFSLEETKSEGESHFTLKLAVDADADFESPEPESSQEITYLIQKGFSKKDIFFYYIYRDIDQYQRQNKERSAEECKKYLKPYFKGMRRDSGWDDIELDALEQEVLTDLDVDDPEKYHAQVDPIPWEGKPQTVLNEISRNSNNFRDRYIFERIADGLNKYDRLFIVYGSAHAVKQEPALRALLENI